MLTVPLTNQKKFPTFIEAVYNPRQSVYAFTVSLCTVQLTTCKFKILQLLFYNFLSTKTIPTPPRKIAIPIKDDRGIHITLQSPNLKRVSLNETIEFPFWGINICVDLYLRDSKKIESMKILNQIIFHNKNIDIRKTA